MKKAVALTAIAAGLVLAVSGCAGPQAAENALPGTPAVSSTPDPKSSAMSSGSMSAPGKAAKIAVTGSALVGEGSS